MTQKKLKIIKNKNIGTDKWKKDPTISDEDIATFNKFFEKIGAKNLIWNREKKPTMKII